MKLFGKGESAKIVLERSVDEAVSIAATDLQRNLQQLSNLSNGFPITYDCCGEPAIYIQTSNNGKKEHYVVHVTDEQVTITGSDILGTVYGIYAFATKCLNILPIYRLVDVFPKRRESMELASQIFEAKERTVSFRGWFLNDEDLLCEYKLSGGTRQLDYPYYQNVMSVDVLDMILETALRLEINLIIPGSFINIDNPDEELLVKAVCRRGLYISQHHVEPMGVSYCSATDYINTYGEEGEKVSFVSNRERMEEIWRYYAKKWAVYGKQVVWQLGLRGKGDQAVWKADATVPITMEARGKIITDAIQTQYDIICQTLGSEDFHSTSTLWFEGSELFGKGFLKLPPNTITVFSDFGFDQMLGRDFFAVPRDENRKYGIYYHVAFWKQGPHLSEGCPIEKMAYNYRQAAKEGKLDYSILNVSNVRPFHFSVMQNAKIVENPLAYDVKKEMLQYDRNIFGKAAEQVHSLRKEYYESFADFGLPSLQFQMSKKNFFYQAYDDMEFLRNGATDGQLTYYGRKYLEGTILEDRVAPKDDIPILIESSNAYQELYRKMEALEKDLAKESQLYFQQFLKHQTKYMYLITEWAIACGTLADPEEEREKRRNAGKYGIRMLEELLDERKILEVGSWENWHRGDRKLNFKKLISMTRDYMEAL